jgi:multiple sugar transport system permease protein/sn-glycerol 3-phosphate transport system permease protein
MTSRQLFHIRETLIFLGLVSINVALLTVFIFYPLGKGIELSLYQWDFISPVQTFVGAKNYVRMWSDRTFWQVMQNTFVYTFFSVICTILCAFGLALLLSLPLRGRNFVRGLVFLPTLLSGAAIALVFNYILDGRYGLLQNFLSMVGLKSPEWYTNPQWAMVSIILTVVWKQSGYGAVILIAGMQNIDHTLYEAASIDGAGRWGKLWNVTIPSLAPMLLFVTVTGILGAFQSFEIIRVMTNGGPINATNILVYNLYERGFVAFEAGPAGVLTVVIFVIMLAVTLLQLKIGEKSNAL